MAPTTTWRNIGNYRCWVNPDFESDELIADLADLPERLASPAIKVLQDGRNRTTGTEASHYVAKDKLPSYSDDCSFHLSM